MADVVEMKGLAQLQARMKALPVELRGQPLKDALLAAAEPIVRDAETLAPKRTGKLARAIVARLNGRTEHDAEVDVTVRTGKSGAYYWKFVEFGHRVRQSRRRTRAEKLAVAELVPAKPFLRPAFEAQKMAALNIFTQKLASGLEAVRQRLVGGSA